MPEVTHYRIRGEVKREDGTVFKNYTPLIYTSQKECIEMVLSLNRQNDRRSVPVYHFVEEFSSEKEGIRTIVRP
jgi:hypothetical protein